MAFKKKPLAPGSLRGKKLDPATADSLMLSPGRRAMTEDNPRSRQAVSNRMQQSDRSLRQPTSAATKRMKLKAGAAARSKRFDAVPERAQRKTLVQSGKPKIQSQLAGKRKKKIGMV